MGTVELLTSSKMDNTYQYMETTNQYSSQEESLMHVWSAYYNTDNVVRYA
jgi:hypothetical protein